MVILLVSLLVAVGIIVGAAVANDRSQARRRNLVFEALAPQDSAVVVDSKTGTAVCKVRGFAILFRFATRGAGSSAESWTECEVNVPHAPLALSLRPQRQGDTKLVAEGLAVDVELGDPVFDARYLIEGAPAAIVKQVLSPEVRRRLLDLDVDEVETRPDGILMARRGWREEQMAVQSFVDAAVSVAEGIGPAIAQVSKVEAPQPESAYRGSASSPGDQQKWQSAQRDAAVRQAAEVAALEAVRARRAEWKNQRMLTISIAAIIVFVVACAFALAK